MCLHSDVYVTMSHSLYSVTFTTADIIVQDGYPISVTSSSIRLSIGLRIPNSASLISPDTIPLVPGDTLINIILRAATPFYLQTGRPILEIQNYKEANMSENTAIIVGTTVPLIILVIAGIGILIL